MQITTEKKRTDYTEGSIIQSILKMGIPSMIGFLANHIYYMVDMWWVAGLPQKETGVAAITIFANISWVFFSFNSLVGTGSVAIISRRYGEKRFDAAETAIKETFVLKWLSGMILGLIGYFITDDLVYMAGARGETIAISAAYGKVVFLGMGFSFATYSVYTAMRGIANPAMAMIIMISSTALNLILDPLFIYGYWGFPELGVTGAAVASVTSYTITFIVGVSIFFYGKTNVRLHLRSKFKMSYKTMIQIIKIGTPSWLGMLSYSASRLLVMPMIALFGNSVVAAYGIGMQITAIGISILVGIGLGLGSLIGHNIGGGKKERALQTANQSLGLAIGLMSVLGVATYLFAGRIMNIYFDSPETIAHGVTLLRIFALAFPFFGVYIMLEQIYAGVGMNTPAMIINAGNAWLLQIPAIFIFTRFTEMDQVAVWWILMLSNLVAASVFYVYFKRGQWLDVKLQ